MNEINDYEDLGDVQLPEEQAELNNKMIEDAENEIEDIRVSFRWKAQQLNIVKKAAEMMGVPYQTYIKIILFKQSVDDLKKAQDLMAK